jgi:hypothetical protein
VVVADGVKVIVEVKVSVGEGVHVSAFVADAATVAVEVEVLVSV